MRAGFIPRGQPRTDKPAKHDVFTLPGVVEIPLDERPCGVYFLLRGKEVVYVGQSVEPRVRVREHVNARLFPKDSPGYKCFDKGVYVPVPLDQLDIVESAFIRFFKPRYNGFSGGRFHASTYDDSRDSEVLAWFGIGESALA